MSDLCDLLESKAGFDYSIPASEEAIKQAETTLHLQFAEDYKEYLCEYGSVTFDGHELTGIGPNKWQDVVESTKRARLASNVPHDCYVIERPGIDGIIIWQNQSGTVFSTAPYAEPKPIAHSLIQYLSNQQNA